MVTVMEEWFIASVFEAKKCFLLLWYQRMASVCIIPCQKYKEFAKL